MLGRRTTMVMLGSVLALAISGCGASVDAPETPNTATRAPIAQNARGKVRLIGEAFGDVALLPEQRAEIEKLAAEADARHATVSAAKQKVVDAVATQVEAGRIDRAALAPVLDAYGDAAAKAMPADRAAIERVHALLNSDQRSELVEAVRERMHEHKDERPRMKRAKEWAEALHLTDEQETRIRDALSSKFEERRRERREQDHGKRRDHKSEGRGRMLDAFEDDTFSVGDSAAADAIREKTRARSERVFGMLETVLPVLTPEQRVLAAAKIRAEGSDALR